MQHHTKDKQDVGLGGRLGGAAFVVVAALGMSACNPHPLKPASTSFSSASSSDVALEVDRKVDVLFVIDDSGSMAEEQAKLAANFAPFIETLDAAGADYRIAVTTTDDGGPGCFGTPEGGRFVARSCLDRPGDFGGQDDLFEATCAANCAYTTEELGIVPTAATLGGELAARPWIESFNGNDNLGEGVTALEAFQCLAPQGIVGCGYERQLESMSRALDRSEAPGEAEFGFLRPGANLLVVIVTDEADCSYNKRFQKELFDPGYGGLFFAEGYNLPTSAICWNAGVECTGSPEGYDSCEAVDLDLNKQPTSVEDNAVLHPVSVYIDRLASLAGDREIMVSVIAGVPQGYGEGVGIDYRASDNQSVERNFGVGYGCTSGEGGDLQWAIPPVRLEEFAASFEGETPNMFSVCADDYTPALQDIVDSVVAEFGPGCFDGCLLDTDPSAAGVQPDCQIIEAVGPDGEEALLEPCSFDGAAFSLPEGVDACWALREDTQERTLSSADDLALECRVEGQNAQFELLRRPGVPVEEGTLVRAECGLSPYPSLDCPAP